MTTASAIWQRVAHPTRLMGLLLATGLFWFWHGTYAFTLPNMACEDGQMMFAYYLNEPSPWGIFRFYYGYISLLPNMIGYLSAQVPPTWSPYVLAWFALLVKAAAHTLFALRRFRGVVASDNARWWISLLLAALPLGNVLQFDNTTYAIWNLLWILLMLAYAPLGTGWLGRLLQFGLMALCIWSHPLALVVAPILLYNLFTRPRAADRWFNAGLLFTLALYLWLGVEVGFTERPRNLAASVLLTPLYLLNRVLFEALFSYHLRLQLYSTGQAWLIYLPALLVVAGVAFWYGRRWRQLTGPTHWQIGLLLYVIGALTWLTIYTRAADATIYMGEWSHRYFYIQQYLVWLGLAVAVYREQHPHPRPEAVASQTRSPVGEGTVNPGDVSFSHEQEKHQQLNEETVPPPAGGRIGGGALPLPNPPPLGEGTVNPIDVSSSHEQEKRQQLNEKTVPPPSGGRLGGGRIFSLALLIIYLAVTNYYNWNYLRTWPDDGRQLAQFLQEIEAYQHSGPHAERREFFLKRDCFDIKVAL